MARKRHSLLNRLFSFLRQSKQLLASTNRRLSWTLLFLLAFIVTLLPSTPVFTNSVLPSAIQTFGVANAQNPGVAALLQKGIELCQAEKFAEAVVVLQQAAELAQADTIAKGTALNYLSAAYQKLGGWAEAEQAISNSLSLLQTLKQRGGSEVVLAYAQALNTQGQLNFSLGKPEQALKIWEQATVTYAQVKDDSGQIISLINQAQALQALGLYKKALDTLIDVNQLLLPQPNSIAKAVGLRSLGNALQTVGDTEKSQEVLKTSLKISEDLKADQATAETLISLGNTTLDPAQARDYYQRAVTIATSPTTRVQAQLNHFNRLLSDEQAKDAEALVPQLKTEIATIPPSRLAVYARLNFANSLMRAEREGVTLLPSNEIAQLISTGVKQAQTLDDQRAESYGLGTLGYLYEQNKQWKEAQSLTQKALLLSQAIKAEDISYRWQWQSGRIFKAVNNPEGAIAAYQESVSTLKALRNDLVSINADAQFSFRESVEPVYRELVDLLLKPGKVEPSQENLKQARNVIESLQLAELENFFRQACLEGNPVQIDQVDQSAAVIYPIILPKRLEVIVSLPQQPLRHYSTDVDQVEVEDVLLGLVDNLFDPKTQDFLPQSQQVYKWLIPADLEKELAQSKVETLTFVLDGVMRNVPMSVLHDGQKFLIEKYGVALTPGLQLLDVRPLSKERLTALIGALTEARQGLPALPGVAVEVNQIKDKVNNELLLDPKFTKQALTTQLKAFSGPIVHLATHGEFSSDAKKTFILTWDDRIDINELSSLIKNRSSGQQGAIELLVLSACKTAQGDDRAALGLAGVAVRAGARSTIGSLWYVNDEATSTVMADFYKELATGSVSKAEALRRAQRTLLGKSGYQHPFFWAPYILVGNWL